MADQDLRELLRESLVKPQPKRLVPSAKRPTIPRINVPQRRVSALERVAAAPTPPKKTGLVGKALSAVSYPFRMEEKAVVRLLSGNQYDTYTEWFKAIGMPKGAAGVTGFAAGIFGVPSTYVGGALIKGGAKAIGAGAKALQAAEPLLKAGKVANLERVYGRVARAVGVKQLSKTSRAAIRMAARMDPAARARLMAVGSGFARFWLPLVTLPKGAKYEKAKGEFLGTLFKHEREIDSIFKTLKGWKPTVRRDVFDFLDGKKTITELPEFSRSLSLKLQARNNEIGQEFVKRGLLTQATVDKHKNAYVKYLYAYHLLGKEEKLAGGGIKMGMKQLMKRDETLTAAQREAKGFIRDVAVAQPYGMSESLGDLAKFDFMELISKNPNWVWQGAFAKIPTGVKGVRKIGVGRKRIAPTMKRQLHAQKKKLTKELNELATKELPKGRKEAARALRDRVTKAKRYREKIDKIDNMLDAKTEGYILSDPKEVVGREYMKEKRWTLGELQEHVAALKKSNSPELAKYQAVLDRMEATAGRAGKDYVQLSTAKGYGPLRGAVIRREIADDIMPMVEGIAVRKNVPGLVNAAAKLQRGALSWFKMLKVAGNPPTAIRNISSNPWQMFLGGVPVSRFVPLAIKAGKSFKAEGRLWKEAAAQGLFKTNFVTGEIDEIVKVARTLPANNLGEWIKNIPNYVRGMTSYYGKIDDFYKLMTFTHFREKGLSIADAAAKARKWIMDYSTVAPSIRVARRYFMPFASFQYKIIPLMAEAMATRPIQTYFMMSIPAMITRTAIEHMDVSEREWELWKNRLPEFLRDNQSVALMPWKKDGNPVWVNLEYNVPWGSAMQLARARKIGDIQKGIGIGNPVVNIVYKVFTDAKGDDPPRDPWSGQEIYSRLDEPKVKLAKSVEWMAGQFVGGAWSRYGAAGKTYAAATGGKLRTGERATPGAAARAWTGILTYSPTKAQSVRSKKYRLMVLKAALNKQLKKPNITPERAERYRQAYIRQAQKIIGAEPGLLERGPGRVRKVRVPKPKKVRTPKSKQVRL
jgi:hypothetical protein